MSILSGFERLLKYIAVCLLVIFFIVFFFRPVETGDIWWHLSTGKYIAQHHHPPYLDPFPFSSFKVKWIFTQWLGSLIYYEIYNFGGEIGLKVFRVVMFVFIFLIFFLYAHRRMSFPLLFLLIIDLIFCLGLRTHLRPYLFNFIFVQLFLIALYNHQDTSDKKYLWPIPLIGMFWVNIHLGSLIYGLLLISLFLFSYILKYLSIRIYKDTDGKKITEVLNKIKDVTIILILYLSTFFISPYGLEGALYPFKAILFPNYIGFYTLSQSIAELLPPLYIFSMQGVCFVILFGIALFMLVKQRRHIIYITDILLFVFAVFLFVYGQRASSFFSIIMAYIIVRNADVVKKWRMSSGINVLVYLVSILFLFVNVLHIVNKYVCYDKNCIRYLSLKGDVLSPKRVLDFLKKNNICGKVYNTDRYGGYIIWHSYPCLRPFADTRQIDFNAYQNYRYIRRSPEQLWDKTAELSGFNIVMLDASLKNNKHLIHYLKDNPLWQMVFIDGFCILFVRRGVFILPSAANNFEKSLSQISLSMDEVSSVLKKNRFGKKRLVDVLKDFVFPSPYFVSRFEEGITLYDMGFKSAGIRYILDTVGVTNRYVLRYALSLMITH